MRHFKLIVLAAALFTAASSALYSQSSSSIVTLEKLEMALETEQIDSELFYDEIIQLLDDLENGELEKTFTLAQLERLNHCLIQLAQLGVLSIDPEEMAILEADTQGLLCRLDREEIIHGFLENIACIFEEGYQGSDDLIYDFLIDGEYILEHPQDFEITAIQNKKLTLLHNQLKDVTSTSDGLYSPQSRETLAQLPQWQEMRDLAKAVIESFE